MILLRCATLYTNSLMPMGVIAIQLGYADICMTEKHYAHLAPSYVANTIWANFPNLGIVREEKVVPLRRVKGAA